ALVDEGGAAAPTKAAHRARFLLRETADVALPRRDAKAFTPSTDVGRVHGPMRKPAGATVIVPSPERGVLHLELHDPAQALAGDNGAAREFPRFHGMRASLETCLDFGHTSSQGAASLAGVRHVDITAGGVHSSYCGGTCNGYPRSLVVPHGGCIAEH